MAELGEPDQLFHSEFVKTFRVGKAELGEASVGLRRRVEDAQQELLKSRERASEFQSFDRYLGHVRALSARGTKSYPGDTDNIRKDRNMDWGLITLDPKRFPTIDKASIIDKSIPRRMYAASGS